MDVSAPRVAVLLLVIALAGCATSAATAPGDPVTAASPPSQPDVAVRLVALKGDAIVELDRRTGRVEQRHPVPPGSGLEDLELVETRDTALVTRRTARGTAEIVEVALDDGRSRVLLDGARPAATADGRELAFTRRVGDDERLELVVAGYDGTEQSVWPAREAGGETLEVASLAWDPTGRRLVLSLRSSAGAEVRVLSVDRRGSLRGASRVIDPSSAGALLATATFRSSRQVTIAEGCCERDGYESWRILAHDLESGSRTELIPDLNRRVTHLDWSADQQRLAVSLGQQPPVVSNWHAGRLEPLADDAASGEW